MGIRHQSLMIYILLFGIVAIHSYVRKDTATIGGVFGNDESADEQNSEKTLTVRVTRGIPPDANGPFNPYALNETERWREVWNTFNQINENLRTAHVTTNAEVQEIRRRVHVERIENERLERLRLRLEMLEEATRD